MDYCPHCDRWSSHSLSCALRTPTEGKGTGAPETPSKTPAIPTTPTTIFRDGRAGRPGRPRVPLAEQRRKARARRRAYLRRKASS